MYLYYDLIIGCCKMQTCVDTFASRNVLTLFHPEVCWHFSYRISKCTDTFHIEVCWQKLFNPEVYWHFPWRSALTLSVQKCADTLTNWSVLILFVSWSVMTLLNPELCTHFSVSRYRIEVSWHFCFEKCAHSHFSVAKCADTFVWRNVDTLLRIEVCWHFSIQKCADTFPSEVGWHFSHRSVVTLLLWEVCTHFSVSKCVDTFVLRSVHTL